MKMQKHTVPVMNVSMFVDRFYISTPAVYAACHYITSSTAETLWLINFVCRLRVLTDVQRFCSEEELSHTNLTYSAKNKSRALNRVTNLLKTCVRM